MDNILTAYGVFCAMGLFPFGIGFAIAWSQRVFAAVADLE